MTARRCCTATTSGGARAVTVCGDAAGWMSAGIEVFAGPRHALHLSAPPAVAKPPCHARRSAPGRASQKRCRCTRSQPSSRRLSALASDKKSSVQGFDELRGLTDPGSAAGCPCCCPVSTGGRPRSKHPTGRPPAPMVACPDAQPVRLQPVVGQRATRGELLRTLRP